jgi:hypothetical protein
MSSFSNFTPDAYRDNEWTVTNLADSIRKLADKKGITITEATKRQLKRFKEASVKTEEAGYQLRLREWDIKIQTGEEIHALKNGAKLKILWTDSIDHPDNDRKKWPKDEHIFIQVEADLADTKHGQELIAAGENIKWKKVQWWVSAEYISPVVIPKKKPATTPTAPVAPGKWGKAKGMPKENRPLPSSVSGQLIKPETRTPPPAPLGWSERRATLPKPLAIQNRIPSSAAGAPLRPAQTVPNTPVWTTEIPWWKQTLGWMWSWFSSEAKPPEVTKPKIETLDDAVTAWEKEKLDDIFTEAFKSAITSPTVTFWKASSGDIISNYYIMIGSKSIDITMKFENWKYSFLNSANLPLTQKKLAEYIREKHKEATLTSPGL